MKLQASEQLNPIIKEYVEQLKYPLLSRSDIDQHFGDVWVRRIGLDCLEKLVHVELINQGKVPR